MWTPKVLSVPQEVQSMAHGVLPQLVVRLVGYQVEKRIFLQWWDVNLQPFQLTVKCFNHTRTHTHTPHTTHTTHHTHPLTTYNTPHTHTHTPHTTLNIHTPQHIPHTHLTHISYTPIATPTSPIATPTSPHSHTHHTSATPTSPHRHTHSCIPCF